MEFDVPSTLVRQTTNKIKKLVTSRHVVVDSIQYGLELMYIELNISMLTKLE
jgi:hypothetical protein